MSFYLYHARKTLFLSPFRWNTKNFLKKRRKKFWISKLIFTFGASSSWHCSWHLFLPHFRKCHFNLLNEEYLKQKPIEPVKPMKNFYNCYFCGVQYPKGKGQTHGRSCKPRKQSMLSNYAQQERYWRMKSEDMCAKKKCREDLIKFILESRMKG